jgi:TIR domain/Interferon-induced transmembrane protein
MQLFISYARPDRSRVDTLVMRLRQAGIDVWLDSDLVGGWPWWDKILGQIRSCDVVLAAVSRASVNSQACRSERRYAEQLGKPILPVKLESMPAGLFPEDIARVQVIDYSQPDDAAAFKLAGAIFAQPKPGPLPNPLPAPPPVPQTRFGDLNDRISAPSLTLEQQLGIIGVLEGALGPASDQEDRESAAEMLTEMAKRPDLYEQAARKIEALQAQVRGAGRNTRQKSPPPRTPPRSKPPPVTKPTPTSSGVNLHRGMAITTAVITFITIFLSPIGIAALIYYSRAKSRLDAGDAIGARKASSRVVAAFWIAVAIWVVIIIVEITVNAANHGGSSGAAMIILPIQR